MTTYEIITIALLLVQIGVAVVALLFPNNKH